MIDVVTIGESMTLLTSENGPMLRSPFLSKGFGGAESNLAVGLARLQHRVAWMSKLGKDPFGDEILYHLRGEGVLTDHVKRETDYPTGLMIKESSLHGDPSVYYYRSGSAASTLKWEDINLSVLDSAKFLHLTGITPSLSENCKELIFKLIEYAHANQIKISLDPNLRLKLWSIEEARATILKLVPFADYFFPGIEEAELLVNVEPGSKSPEQLCRYFYEMGAKNVVMKLGEEGCAVLNHVGFQKVPGYKVTPVDTVGAGDGFCAGFLSGLLNNLSDLDSARRANAVGAIAVSANGDYDALPTLEGLETFMGLKKEVKR